MSDREEERREWREGGEEREMGRDGEGERERELINSDSNYAVQMKSAF